jgi:predicted nucleic acid-binding protein
LELTETLSKRKFSGKIASSGFLHAELANQYARLAAVVRPMLVPRLSPDPDDDVVIGMAIAAGAELIVTGDRTLVSRARFDGGRIVSVQ